MSHGLMLSPVVLAAKTSLQEGQQKLQTRHAQGSPGIQVCAKLTDLADLANLIDLADLIDFADLIFSEMVLKWC